MEDEAPVAKEGAGAANEGGVVIGVGGGKRVVGDLAVLARKVANLAGLGGGGVAGGALAALEGVEVAQSIGAVAVGGHGLVVDVVD